jgi:hypothetical protein
MGSSQIFRCFMAKTDNNTNECRVSPPPFAPVEMTEFMAL